MRHVDIWHRHAFFGHWTHEGKVDERIFEQARHAFGGSFASEPHEDGECAAFAPEGAAAEGQR